MEEPISTYYFKHGVAGLSGVHAIGIKEVPSSAFVLVQPELENRLVRVSAERMNVP